MKHPRLQALSLALLMMGAPLSGGAKPAKRRAAPRSAPAATSSKPAPAVSGAIDEERPDQREAERATAGGNDAKEREAPPPAPPPAAAETRKPVVAANNDAPADDAKPAPPAPPPPPAPGPSIDLEKLRADYDRLRDELFRTRSRAQLVEDNLWKSRLSATFRWKGGPDYLVHHASVRLDGGEIWDSGDKPVTDNLITVAERAVKAGSHAITLRIEIRPGKKAKDSDRLGYVSEHTFAIVVPEDKHTKVEITGDEDGDAPEYEPEIEVEVESKK